MDKREAKVLFERCLPRFLDAGLQSISDWDRWKLNLFSCDFFESELCDLV